MLKFSEYESTNEGFLSNLEGKLSKDYYGAKKYVLDLLDKSLNSSELLDLQNFIKSFLEDKSDAYITGLNDDSELFEFYVKYQVELDELLSKEDFFAIEPKKMSIFSVYDYVVEASEKSLKLLLKNIQDEVFPQN